MDAVWARFVHPRHRYGLLSKGGRGSTIGGVPKPKTGIYFSCTAKIKSLTLTGHRAGSAISKKIGLAVSGAVVSVLQEDPIYWQ